MTVEETTRQDKVDKFESKSNRLGQGGKNNSKNNNGRGGKNNKQQVKQPTPPVQEKKEDEIKTITLPETMTIKELADAMKIQASAIIKKLFLEGVMVTVNQEIDFEKAEEIALEFNCICEKEVKVDVIEELLRRRRKIGRAPWLQDRRLSVLWVTLTMVRLPFWMQSVTRNVIGP